MKVADMKAAAERVQRWRQRKAAEAKKKARHGAEREAVERFRKFLEVARRSKHTRQLQEIAPIIKRLGNGEMPRGWKVIGQWEGRLKDGTPSQEIWKILRGNTKRIFEATDSEIRRQDR